MERAGRRDAVPGVVQNLALGRIPLYRDGMPAATLRQLAAPFAQAKAHKAHALASLELTPRQTAALESRSGRLREGQEQCPAQRGTGGRFAERGTGRCGHFPDGRMRNVPPPWFTLAYPPNALLAPDFC